MLNQNTIDGIKSAYDTEQTLGDTGVEITPAIHRGVLGQVIDGLTAEINRVFTNFGGTVRSGTGVPANNLGENGDFYIDSANASVYGPKTNDVWGNSLGEIGSGSGVAGLTETQVDERIRTLVETFAQDGNSALIPQNKIQNLSTTLDAKADSSELVAEVSARQSADAVLQNNIDAKAPLNNPNLTGTATVNSSEIITQRTLPGNTLPGYDSAARDFFTNIFSERNVSETSINVPNGTSGYFSFFGDTEAFNENNLDGLIISESLTHDPSTNHIDGLVSPTDGGIEGEGEWLKVRWAITNFNSSINYILVGNRHTNNLDYALVRIASGVLQYNRNGERETADWQNITDARSGRIVFSNGGRVDVFMEFKIHDNGSARSSTFRRNIEGVVATRKGDVITADNNFYIYTDVLQLTSITGEVLGTNHIFEVWSTPEYISHHSETDHLNNTDQRLVGYMRAVAHSSEYHSFAGITKTQRFFIGNTEIDPSNFVRTDNHTASDDHIRGFIKLYAQTGNTTNKIPIDDLADAITARLIPDITGISDGYVVKLVNGAVVWNPDLSGTGSGGLSEAEVDARIKPYARAGSTGADALIPLNAIPSDIARDSEVPGNTEIDARIAPPARANNPTGQFNVARIPNLNASKITAGTFNVSLIPNLDAAKIISGTLDDARIPDLSQSKITNLGDSLDAKADSNAIAWRIVTAVPGNSVGNDLEFAFVQADDASDIVVYQKISGTWTSQGTLMVSEGQHRGSYSLVGLRNNVNFKRRQVFVYREDVNDPWIVRVDTDHTTNSSTPAPATSINGTSGQFTTIGFLGLGVQESTDLSDTPASWGARQIIRSSNESNAADRTLEQISGSNSSGRVWGRRAGSTQDDLADPSEFGIIEGGSGGGSGGGGPVRRFSGNIDITQNERGVATTFAIGSDKANSLFLAKFHIGPDGSGQQNQQRDIWFTGAEFIALSETTSTSSLALGAGSNFVLRSEFWEGNSAVYGIARFANNIVAVGTNSASDRDVMPFELWEFGAGSNSDSGGGTDTLGSITGTAEGDLVYNNGSAWVRLGKGNDGEVLKSTSTSIGWGADNAGDSASVQEYTITSSVPGTDDGDDGDINHTINTTANTVTGYQKENGSWHNRGQWSIGGGGSTSQTPVTLTITTIASGAGTALRVSLPSNSGTLSAYSMIQLRINHSTILGTQALWADDNVGFTIPLHAMFGAAGFVLPVEGRGASAPFIRIHGSVLSYAAAVQATGTEFFMTYWDANNTDEGTISNITAGSGVAIPL